MIKFSEFGGEILGGYSLLPDEKYIIRYMNPDGSINGDRLNKICQEIANAGGKYIREFPGWPTNNPHWQKLTPFWMINGKVKWNKLYFSNWVKIFRFMKEQYDLTPIFCLFNASETRVEELGAKQNSPWKAFNEYFYTQDSEGTRHIFIDLILDCAKEAKVEIWLELCNEPPVKSRQMMAETFDYLVIKKGFPMERVISGWDIYLKKRGDEMESDALKLYAYAYRSWRNECAQRILDSGKFEVFGNTEYKKLEYIMETYLKGTIWTTFHGCNFDTVGDYFGPNVLDSTHRNQMYSTDGAKNKKGDRLTYQDGYELARLICQEKPNAIRKGKIFLSMLATKEAGVDDPYGAIRGAGDCLISYGYILENRGKYPEPKPLPEWLEGKNPEPKPEEKYIKILTPQNDEYYKITDICKIKYETNCPDGAYIRIYHAKNKTYSEIPSAEQIQVDSKTFCWHWQILEDIKEAVIHVRLYDEGLFMSHEVRINIKENPMKKQTFFQKIINALKWAWKNRRFWLGGIVIIGTIIAVRKQWWWVGPGLLLNHGLWHFKIFKQRGVKS